MWLIIAYVCFTLGVVGLILTIVLTVKWDIVNIYRIVTGRGSRKYVDKMVNTEQFLSEETLKNDTHKTTQALLKETFGFTRDLNNGEMLTKSENIKLGSKVVNAIKSSPISITNTKDKIKSVTSSKNVNKAYRMGEHTELLVESDEFIGESDKNLDNFVGDTVFTGEKINKDKNNDVEKETSSNATDEDVFNELGKEEATSILSEIDLDSLIGDEDNNSPENDELKEVEGTNEKLDSLTEVQVEEDEEPLSDISEKAPELANESSESEEQVLDIVSEPKTEVDLVEDIKNVEDVEDSTVSNLEPKPFTTMLVGDNEDEDGYEDTNLQEEPSELEPEVNEIGVSDDSEEGGNADSKTSLLDDSEEDDDSDSKTSLLDEWTSLVNPIEGETSSTEAVPETNKTGKGIIITESVPVEDLVTPDPKAGNFMIATPVDKIQIESVDGQVEEPEVEEVDESGKTQIISEDEQPNNFKRLLKEDYESIEFHEFKVLEVVTSYNRVVS